MVTCDVGATQCDNEIVKCEKKNKGTTKYDKSTIICDVGIAQCDNEIVKYKKKKLKYHRM